MANLEMVPTSERIADGLNTLMSVGLSTSTILELGTRTADIAMDAVRDYRHTGDEDDLQRATSLLSLLIVLNRATIKTD